MVNYKFFPQFTGLNMIKPVIRFMKPCIKSTSEAPHSPTVLSPLCPRFFDRIPKKKKKPTERDSVTMEDADGLSFDFEGGLDSGPAQPTASVPPENASSAAINVAPSYDHSAASVAGAGRGRSFRQTVCRHWLRSLCMKGDACGFLHQFDKARMPICRFFRQHGECREPDCNFKHTNEDAKECNMYVHKTTPIRFQFHVFAVED